MFVAFKNLARRFGAGCSTGHQRLAPLDWAAVWIVVATVLVLASPTGPAPSATVAPLWTATSPSSGAEGGSWVPTQDSWNDQLRNPAFWAERKSGKSSSSSGWSAPSGLGRAQPNFLPPLPSWASLPIQRRGGNPFGSDDDDDRSSKGGGKTFRTMCVRLCDGFFFPVSFATTKDNFERDAATCERNCGGATDARLFTYRNPGGEIEEMEDLDGKPYKKLQTAFLFRTKYEPSCKCRAHPWEEASQTRHKTYALGVAAQKGDTAAVRELNSLKVKMLDEARAAARDKQALAKLKREAALEDKAAADAARAAKRGNKTVKLDDGRSTRSGATKPSFGVAAKSTDRQPIAGQPGGQLLVIRQPSDGRAGNLPDPAAGPAGGPTSIVILRYGSRPPLEVSVPRRQAITPVPRRRDADARPFPDLTQQQ